MTPNSTNREVEMRRLLAGIERRGESLYAFARRTDTPYQTLVYWRRRLRGLRRSSKPKFLEVRPIARPTDPFELVLPDGRMLRIPASFDRDALAQLLAALDR
jgi:hypothetical protein